MAKRFTCTDKWSKAWFRRLDSEYKLFWVFILDRCNHAGVLDWDIELFNFMLGITVNTENVKNAYGDKILFFKNDEKIFIPGFIDFQYGPLNEANRVHKSVIDMLKKYGLCKHLISPLKRAKDKDMDMDKEKDMDKDMELFEDFWFLYDKKVGKQSAIKEWLKLDSETKQKIIQAVPAYTDSKEKKFRKDPERYLKYRVWEDEVIVKKNNNDKAWMSHGE